MDFEGKEKLKEYIEQGQTLLNVNAQLQQQLMQMNSIIANLTGQDLSNGQGAAVPYGERPDGAGQAAQGQSNPIMTAQGGAANNALNSYAKQLVERGKV